MSRLPISAAAPQPAPAYRANMMRATPVGARPHAKRAHVKAVARKAPRKAVSSPHRRRAARPPVRVAAAPQGPRPTPVWVASQELATPRAYALITTTVCETGPAPIEVADLGGAAAPAADELGTPASDVAPAPGGRPTLVGFPADETGYPPIFEGVVLGPPPGGVFLPPETPVTDQPGVTPPTDQTPGETPPGPPGETSPGVVTPPGDTPLPPDVFPPTSPPGPAAVPEPGTWALLILGLGATGAALRRRRRNDRFRQGF